MHAEHAVAICSGSATCLNTDAGSAPAGVADKSSCAEHFMLNMGSVLLQSLLFMPEKWMLLAEHAVSIWERRVMHAVSRWAKFVTPFWKWQAELHAR